MMGSSLSAPPQPLWWVPIQPLNLITTAASLRLGFLVHSSFKNISHLCHVPRLKDVWHEKASRLQGNDFLQFSNDIFASTCSSCMCFFHGGGTRQGSGNEGSPNMETSGRKFFLRKLLPEESCCSGVPSLIDKGQFWRLATSSVLHANIGHLMVNCYSLNSIGPTIENLSGPRRFIAVLPLQ
uniref:Peptidase S54 rhomboid domain-containing protein n=1 Tax=Salix viminalis TaxID=40686 RepID=A0A6N2MNR6_SALVM